MLDTIRRHLEQHEGQWMLPDDLDALLEIIGGAIAEEPEYAHHACAVAEAERLRAASEREQIARYLEEQWHHLQKVKGTWLMLGVRWAIDRILDKSVTGFDPEPTESLEEFLGRGAT